MASIDAILVRLTLQGDQDAFARLIQRHRPGLLRLALSHVGNLSEAEDIVQEASIKAYQHLSTLQTPARFPAWMYRMTRNLCYMALRKRGFESLDALVTADDSMAPDIFAEGHELSESIVKAVETLPDKNQGVFLLYLEGWSYRDIATTYRLPTSTVLGRIQRSKQFVKKKVSKDVHLTASHGRLQIERGYLREEIYKMSEGILKPKALRRRIYGLGHRYHLQLDNPQFSIRSATMYLFRGLLSGRMQPDIFLENGGRFYQLGLQSQKNTETEGTLTEDLPRPIMQFSTPECDALKMAVIYQKAGEHLLEKLASSAFDKMKSDGISVEDLGIYQGAGQNSGHPADSQENYLVDAKVTRDRFQTHLVPFLVTRQIFTGAGAIGTKNGQPTYLISARGSRIREIFTEKAAHIQDGIIRDTAPHADKERYKRLQVILNDANRAEPAIYLKIGTTAIVLQMIEDDAIHNDLSLSHPVEACRTIATDESCTQPVTLQNGTSRTAIEIQRDYLSFAHRYFSSRPTDPEVEDLLRRWESVLERLETDATQADREVDWVIKKRLIDEVHDESGGLLNHPRVLDIDLNYHQLGENSIFTMSNAERLTTDADIDHAMHCAPETTRAYFRGRFVKLANERKISCRVNWSYIQLYTPYQKLFLSINPLQLEYNEASQLVRDGGPYPSFE